ncbi:hypothetical protein ACFL5N_00095, partial [bacterium]
NSETKKDKFNESKKDRINNWKDKLENTMDNYIKNNKSNKLLMTARQVGKLKGTLTELQTDGKLKQETKEGLGRINKGIEKAEKEGLIQEEFSTEGFKDFRDFIKDALPTGYCQESEDKQKALKKDCKDIQQKRSENFTAKRVEKFWEDKKEVKGYNVNIKTEMGWAYTDGEQGKVYKGKLGEAKASSQVKIFNENDNNSANAELHLNSKSVDILGAKGQIGMVGGLEADIPTLAKSDMLVLGRYAGLELTFVDQGYKTNITGIRKGMDLIISADAVNQEGKYIRVELNIEGFFKDKEGGKKEEQQGNKLSEIMKNLMSKNSIAPPSIGAFMNEHLEKMGLGGLSGRQIFAIDTLIMETNILSFKDLANSMFPHKAGEMKETQGTARGNIAHIVQSIHGF